MMKQNFEYLEDGQTEPRIKDWQARLLSSREEVLSVLSDAVEKATLSDAEADWGAISTSVREAIARLLDVLDAASRNTPLPRGFFVGEVERKPAYETACRALGKLEREHGDLRAAFLHLMRFLEGLENATRDSTVADLYLREASLAAGRLGDACAQEIIAALGTDLNGQIGKNGVLREKGRGLCEALQTLCTARIPTFCDRILVLVDMEREGEKCDPVGLVRLYGELREAIRKTIIL